MQQSGEFSGSRRQGLSQNRQPIPASTLQEESLSARMEAAGCHGLPSAAAAQRKSPDSGRLYNGPGGSFPQQDAAQCRFIDLE